MEKEGTRWHQTYDDQGNTKYAASKQILGNKKNKEKRARMRENDNKSRAKTKKRKKKKTKINKQKFKEFFSLFQAFYQMCFFFPLISSGCSSVVLGIEQRVGKKRNMVAAQKKRKKKKKIFSLAISHGQYPMKERNEGKKEETSAGNGRPCLTDHTNFLLCLFFAIFDYEKQNKKKTIILWLLS